MTRLNEKEVIALFSSKLGIKRTINNANDDAAVLHFQDIVDSFGYEGCNAAIVLKSDMLVESTDVPPHMLLWQVARKSVVACVSDMSAKGISPPYLCLISIGIPSTFSKCQIIDLIKGFQRASKEFGVKVVGGDTNRSNELVIDCSMVGVSPGGSYIPKRKGARPGDIVVSSGLFGFSSSGLRILTDNAMAKGHFKRIAIESVLMPVPRQMFGISLAKFFSSSIDSSDGLAASTYELAKQSGVNLVIDNDPSAGKVQQFAVDNGLTVRDLVFYGGEEYEIIATIPEGNLETARTLSAKTKLKLYVIGKVEKGDGKVIILSDRGRRLLLREGGYMHRFSTIRRKRRTKKTG